MSTKSSPLFNYTVNFTIFSREEPVTYGTVAMFLSICSWILLTLLLFLLANGTYCLEPNAASTILNVSLSIATTPSRILSRSLSDRQLVLLYRNGKNRKVIYDNDLKQQSNVAFLDLQIRQYRGKLVCITTVCEDISNGLLYGVYASAMPSIFLAFLSRGNNYLAVFSLLDCTISIPRNIVIYLYIHLLSPSSMRIRFTSLRTQLRGVTSMFLAARLSSIVSAFHHWDERYIRGPIGTSVVFRIGN